MDNSLYDNDEMAEQYHQACKDGDMAVVQQLKDAMVWDNQAYTGLLLACQHGHLDIVKSLIQEPPAALSLDYHQYVRLPQTFDTVNALTAACMGGHMDIVTFFVQEVDNPIQVHAPEISYACFYGHFTLVDYLFTLVEQPDVVVNQVFLRVTGNVEAMRHLLTSPTLPVHADIRSHSDVIIQDLCKAVYNAKAYFTAIHYLFTSPELSDHLDIMTPFSSWKEWVAYYQDDASLYILLSALPANSAQRLMTAWGQDVTDWLLSNNLAIPESIRPYLGDDGKEEITVHLN